MTPYDRDSIMNYCNSQYNNHGNLSLSDIAGLQFWYGPTQGSGPWHASCRSDVLIYKDRNFQGKWSLVTGSMDDLGPIGLNDRISSLCVPAGMDLKLFKDKGFAGKVSTFHGPANVRNLTTDNDQASSLQLIDVRKDNAVVYDAPNDCVDHIVLFEDSFFRGKCLKVDAAATKDECTLVKGSSNDLKRQKFGDKISSVCVPAGQRLTMFRDKDYKGKSLSLVGPFYRTNLGTMGWDDAVSSISPN